MSDNNTGSEQPKKPPSMDLDAGGAPKPIVQPIRSRPVDPSSGGAAKPTPGAGVPSQPRVPSRPLPSLDAGNVAKPAVPSKPVAVPSRPVPPAPKPPGSSSPAVPSRPVDLSAKPSAAPSKPPSSTSPAVPSKPADLTAKSPMPPAPAAAPKPAMPPGAAKSSAVSSARAKMPPVSQLKGRQLGRVLIKMGRITRTQAAEAKDIQTRKGGPIGQILMELGYVNEDDLQLALAAQMGMEPIDISKIDLAPEIVSILPAQTAHTYKVVPVEWQPETRTLSIAIASPDNFQATDDLEKLMGYKIRPCLSSPEDIEAALARYYPEDAAESIHTLIDELAGDEELAALAGRGESIDLDVLKEAAESNPVKKLLNLVLLQAIRDKASDVHFEPFEDEFKMRYRIDGVLYEMVPPPRHIAMAIASRIKVMANLNIAERRIPQDGRIELTVGGNPVDLRVAVLPTMFGESVVMRVLDRANVKLDLDRIGLRDDELQILRQLINKPNGIVVNTGPTGSGKTTTLYSALRELNTIDVKILTAEDPVEYDIDGLIQCQVNPEIGLTFAKCLRSFLRQDPDVILVGEIRDLETAKIAVESSLTGHLVFSTLHTNDSPSAIARLLDLGVEPFLLTATLEAIVGQRLVRRICENCKDEFHPTQEMLLELELKQEDIQGRPFFYGRGCDYCNNTGYRGRLGIFEIMVLDDDLRDLIMKRASTNVLRAEARKRGMRTLRESGLMAIADGFTTIEEVVKETIMEEG